MNKLGIVIAKYKEDLTWIKEINIPCDVFIYNKGNKDDIGNLNSVPINSNVSINIENLPNIGRESHTYIYHIVTNYNVINDHIIFLQGNPKSHCKNIVSIINGHYTYSLEKINFEFLADLTSVTNIITNPYVAPFLKFCEKKQSTPKSDLVFGHGAQFVASKNYILKHSLEFYKELQKFCNEHVTDDKDAADVYSPYIAPWAMERIWKYIF